MNYSVSTERRGAVLIVTLDRPKANAIDCKTSLELYNIFEAFESDPELNVAILTGAGEKFFSAGWDLNAASEGEAVDADHGPGGFAGLTEYFSRTKPIIAAVNGMAVGGGFELALSCDFIIAVPHAKFFLPEGRIGIVPDSGGVFRLSNMIPKAIAMEVFLCGKRIEAAEAKHLGLVNQVVEPEQLIEKSLEVAELICQTAPLAQRAIKELVSAGESFDLPMAFTVQRDGSLPNYTKMLTSKDAEEGTLAFSEGRTPVWKGE
jgi:crotonobetainyl-CoA hydratase